MDTGPWSFIQRGTLTVPPPPSINPPPPPRILENLYSLILMHDAVVVHHKFPPPPNILYETLQREVPKSVGGERFSRAVKGLHCLISRCQGHKIYCLLRCPHFSVLIRGIPHNHNSLSSVVFDHFLTKDQVHVDSIFSIISTLQSSVSSTTLSNREEPCRIDIYIFVYF